MTDLRAWIEGATGEPLPGWVNAYQHERHAALVCAGGIHPELEQYRGILIPRRSLSQDIRRRVEWLVSYKGEPAWTYWVGHNPSMALTEPNPLARYLRDPAHRGP